jgi:hypothetical protein
MSEVNRQTTGGSINAHPVFVDKIPLSVEKPDSA